MIGYLIDMDGVIYRGSEMIHGAVEFINELIDREVPFTFLTNNSQRSQLDVVTKLRRLGMEVDSSHVYTCAMATAEYIATQGPHRTAYVIGESGLLTALNALGIAIVDKDPDFVVIGEGRTFNAESFEAALNLVMGGARLIATNLDPNCPTQSGVRPGCGAMVALLEVASGRQAFSVGKPNPIMMRAARKSLGLNTRQTVMIGDTMQTDILGGVQLGFHTVLVLSGGTQLHDVHNYAYKPDVIVNSIAELNHERLVGRIEEADPVLAA